MFETTQPLEYIFLESYSDYLNEDGVERSFENMLIDALIHADFQAGEIVIRISDRNLFSLGQSMFIGLAQRMGYRFEVRGSGHYVVFDIKNNQTVFGFYNTISTGS